MQESISDSQSIISYREKDVNLRRASTNLGALGTTRKSTMIAPNTINKGAKPTQGDRVIRPRMSTRFSISGEAALGLKKIQTIEESTNITGRMSVVSNSQSVIEEMGVENDRLKTSLQIIS